MIFEKKGDVFAAHESSALMHCVSADGAMSKGIAAEFVQRYPEIKILRKQRNKVGSMVPLASRGRIIYNLVSKLNRWDKPEVSSLQACLLSVREHAQLAGIKDISLPRIGTGLDKLSFMKHVLPSIKMAFKDSDINIWVYSLQENPIEG